MGACGSIGSRGIFPFGGTPGRLTKEQTRAIATYLPDFRIYEVSNDTHRQIAATHWNDVFREAPSSRSTRASLRSTMSSGRQRSTAPKTQSDSRISALYDAFYQYLDEHSPELKPVFRSSMHVRSKVLVHISAGMRAILSSQHVMEKTLALTQTHLRFGVKLEFFNPLGNALLHAMRVASEDAWTPEIEDAWRRLFTHCSAILLVHHKKALDRKVQVKQHAESNQTQEGVAMAVAVVPAPVPAPAPAPVGHDVGPEIQDLSSPSWRAQVPFMWASPR